MNIQEQLEILNSLEIVDELVSSEESFWMVEPSLKLKVLVESIGWNYEKYLQERLVDGQVDLMDLAFHDLKVDTYKQGKFIRYTEEELRQQLHQEKEERLSIAAENEEYKELLRDIRSGFKALEILADMEDEDLDGESGCVLLPCY